MEQAEVPNVDHYHLQTRQYYKQLDLMSLDVGKEINIFNLGVTNEK